MTDASHLITSFARRYRTLKPDHAAKENETVLLVAPGREDTYPVSISFNAFTDDPDRVRVRATNWRAENEPSGVYRRADAEAMYRAAIKAGFTLPVKDGEVLDDGDAVGEKMGKNK